MQCAVPITAAKQQRAGQFIKITQRCHLSLASMAACLACRACCRKQSSDTTNKFHRHSVSLTCVSFASMQPLESTTIHSLEAKSAQSFLSFKSSNAIARSIEMPGNKRSTLPRAADVKRTANHKRKTWFISPEQCEATRVAAGIRHDCVEEGCA